ncbi:MAG: T9SS type A sorting domain-containing protein [Saprospiraceae bacterium]|nr:T9SS type A sorting domain-containing protein [Saprospiraceae bacterium]
MKNYIFILLLVFSCNLSAQYFPTVEDNPIWKTDFSSVSGSGQSEITLHQTIDTCGNLWTAYEEAFDFPDFNFTSRRYFRQEGKRYFYKEYLSCTTKEYLMYDFGLEEGDSAIVGIPGTYFESDPNLDTLTLWAYSIDTLYYGGIPRRTLQMSFSPSSNALAYTWIEGIGASYHPFPPSTCFTFTPNCEISYSGNCLETISGVLFTRNPNDGILCEYDVNHYFVDQGVEGGDEDGSSWEDAFSNLQQAIELAEYGDTIWVAEGTYFSTDDDDRTKSFILKDGVALYGGFDGTETNLEERNWENNFTILSGNIGALNDSTDNSYHVLYGVGTDSTTVLDGFYIEGGHAVINNPNLNPNARGGGIYLGVSEEYPICSPKIRNCTFQNNVAIYGGAIYCDDSEPLYASPNLVNCHFRNNRGTFQGGAIYKEGGVSDIQQQEFIGCTFFDNWAWQGGGAIAINNMSDSYYFEDCLFERDTAFLEGGAIFISSQGSGNLNFNKCRFEHNNGLTGGAILFITFGNEENLQHSIEMSECIFFANSARAADGGALTIDYSNEALNMHVVSTKFENNQSTSRGGGIFISLGNFATSNLHIDDCEFINNSGSEGSGGAISIRGQIITNDFQYSNTYINNSLFFNNQRVFLLERGTGGTGYARFTNSTFINNGDYPIGKSWNNAATFEENDTQIELYNCILWETESLLPQIFLNGSFQNENLYGYRFGNCLFYNMPCLVDGVESACLPENIFETDPLFVDFDENDFRLKACSPAINAGNNDLAIPSERDLQGEVRILNDTIDIGAYEREQFHLDISATIIPESSSGASDGAIIIDEITGGTAPYSYLWSNGDNQANIDMLSAGMYSLSVTDEENCSQSWTFDVDLISSTTSADENLSIKVFPNPSTGSLILSSEIVFPRGSQLKVFDLLGQLHLVENLGSGKRQQFIDISSLPNGIYLLQIVVDEKQIKSYKILKQ